MDKTVSCKALAEFVEFVDGYGMVVSNGSGEIDVPESAVERLADAGKIEAPKGKKAKEPAAEEPALEAAP